jgi:hypothetical protein
MKTLTLTISAISLLWVGCSETSTSGPTLSPDGSQSSSQEVSSSSVSTPVEISSSSITIETPVASDSLLLWVVGSGTQVATEGYWFGYDDELNGGSSTWSCGGVKGTEGADFEFCVDETTEEISVDFVTVADVPNGVEVPFGIAGIGFNLGADVEGVKDKVDLSAYTKLIIEYVATEKIFMQMVFDEEAVEYDVHHVVLSANETSKTILLKDFEQAGWGTSADLLENLKVMTEIKFQAHTSNFSGEGKLNVKSIVLK